MLGQGCLPAETPITSWFLANVGSLSRMNPPMTSQARRIREGFLATFMIADMRLFTRVGPRMDSQRTALDKTLIAVLYGAMIRAFIGVYSVVSAEI